MFSFFVNIKKDLSSKRDVKEYNCVKSSENNVTAKNFVEKKLSVYL